MSTEPDAQARRGLAGVAGAAIVRRPRSVAGTLLAEDLLLLLTGDASGRLTVPSAQVDAGLGGAAMVELTLMATWSLSGATRTALTCKNSLNKPD
jgi:hypothetical protein